MIVAVSFHIQQCDNVHEYNKKMLSGVELSFLCVTSLSFLPLRLLCIGVCYTVMSVHHEVLGYCGVLLISPTLFIVIILKGIQ